MDLNGRKKGSRHILRVMWKYFNVFYLFAGAEKNLCGMGLGLGAGFKGLCVFGTTEA